MSSTSEKHRGEKSLIKLKGGVSVTQEFSSNAPVSSEILCTLDLHLTLLKRVPSAQRIPSLTHTHTRREREVREKGGDRVRNEEEGGRYTDEVDIGR